jgi:hypothetical protein
MFVGTFTLMAAAASLLGVEQNHLVYVALFKCHEDGCQASC